MIVFSCVNIEPVLYCMVVISELERLKQEDCYEFQAILGYRVNMSQTLRLATSKTKGMYLYLLMINYLDQQRKSVKT